MFNVFNFLRVVLLALVVGAGWTFSLLYLAWKDLQRITARKWRAKRKPPAAPAQPRDDL